LTYSGSGRGAVFTVTLPPWAGWKGVAPPRCPGSTWELRP